MIVLQINNLSKKYNRKPVFQDLELEHTGGVLGIAGANGSGKSTLMKCLAYLLRPSSGEVIWKQSGRSLSHHELRQVIGFAAPYINLYSELSIEENLRFLLEAGGEKVEVEYLLHILEKTQLLELKTQPFGRLSTGQQQRVKIAGALIRDPQILLLDEPGSNLDEKGHLLIKNIVEDANASGKLVVLASNDPNELILCEKRIELN